MKKVWWRKEKGIRWKTDGVLIISKIPWNWSLSRNQSSRKDYEKFASSTNFIRLAKWFNVNFQNVLRMEKRLVPETLAYAELKATNPVFPAFCQMKTITWRRRMETKFNMLSCLHWVWLKAKLLISLMLTWNKSFPCFVLPSCSQKLRSPKTFESTENAYIFLKTSF